MANKQRGEIAFGEYTLCFGINAICELEAKFKTNTQGVLAKIQGLESDMNLTLARDIFHVALKDFQPDLTVDEAGRAITNVGLSKSFEILQEAVFAAFPEARIEGGDEGPNPTKTRTRRRTG